MNRNAIRSAVTSFLTAFGFALLVNLPEDFNDLGWPVVGAAAYSALRTTVVALNKSDPSYGIGSDK